MCTCVSKSLTSVCHRELKALRLESKHCSKYKREAEEQEQSGAHTVKQRGLNATEAERANTGERREERGEKRAAQRLRHTAQTGIKELEGKESKGG